MSDLVLLTDACARAFRTMPRMGTGGGNQPATTVWSAVARFLRPRARAVGDLLEVRLSPQRRFESEVAAYERARARRRRTSGRV